MPQAKIIYDHDDVEERFRDLGDDDDTSQVSRSSSDLEVNSCPPLSTAGL